MAEPGLTRRTTADGAACSSAPLVVRVFVDARLALWVGYIALTLMAAGRVFTMLEAVRNRRKLRQLQALLPSLCGPC